MEIQFKIVGFIFVFLAFIHLGFSKYFHWQTELKSLSLINMQMMQVHTFFIALIIFLMGLLCLYSTTELINTKLGKTISFGFGIFWLIRLLIQLFVYSTKLWKGKLFETLIHIIFTGLWIYLSVLFFINSLN